MGEVIHINQKNDAEVSPGMVHLHKTGDFSINHSFLTDGVNESFNSIDYTKINPYIEGSGKSFTFLLSLRRQGSTAAYTIPFGNYNGSNFTALIEFGSSKVALILQDTINKQIQTSNVYGSTTNWYHFAFIVNGITPANSDLLVNNVSDVGVNTLTGNVSTRNTNYQFGASGNSDFYSNNYLSQISLINKAISGAEATSWYNDGKPKNPQTLFGSNCKMFLSADNSGDNAQFTMTDSANGITTTSANMEDADKTTVTPY